MAPAALPGRENGPRSRPGPGRAGFRPRRALRHRRAGPRSRGGGCAATAGRRRRGARRIRRRERGRGGELGGFRAGCGSRPPGGWPGPGRPWAGAAVADGGAGGAADGLAAGLGRGRPRGGDRSGLRGAPAVRGGRRPGTRPPDRPLARPPSRRRGGRDRGHGGGASALPWREGGEDAVAAGVRGPHSPAGCLTSSLIRSTVDGSRLARALDLDVQSPFLNPLEQLLALQSQFFRQLVNARGQRQLLPDGLRWS